MQSAMRIYAAALLLITSGLAMNGQNPPSKPNPSAAQVVKATEDFSVWSIEALLRERDSLVQQIPDTTTQINWINDAIAKRAARDQLLAKHKPTDEIDKALSDSMGYAGIPGAQTSELETRLAQRQSLLEEKQTRKAAIDSELTRR